MSRILRAEGGWATGIADALARAERPIPYDERLLPRNPDGSTRPRVRQPRPDAPAPRRAATLLAIYPDGAGELVVPLTVRRDDMTSHAGEVSLPGGSVDPHDADETAAALREAWEEVGIEPDEVNVVGTLDEVWIPVTNFVLRPIVGTLERRPALVPHDAEVASVVELPLAALYDPTVVGDEAFTSSRGGWRIRAGAYRYGGVRVWGATAITLGMLARVLDSDRA